MYIYTKLKIKIDMFHVLCLVMVIVLSEAMAQFFIRKYTIIPVLHYYILGALFYSVVAWMLHVCYQYKNMGIINTLWSGLSIVTILTVGLVFFGDTIDKYEFTGMTLILIGVIVMQIKN